MRRREFITLVGSAAAAWPLVARAQQAPVRPIIGVLSPISIAAAARNTEALRTGLRDLGYSEGHNITLEQRYADGAIERLPDLAAELVALKPAVIVAGSPAAALAVRNATRSIPVVMNSSPDPVRLGLAGSIARPGGNVTGFWWGDETVRQYFAPVRKPPHGAGRACSTCPPTRRVRLPRFRRRRRIDVLWGEPV
jgi:putative tryptophan/tyrosine transport system substrate-binding protein